MLARRFAMAIGLMLAVATSQLPEYVQQYRQRLGGAIDELKAMIGQFDAEAARLSLDRVAGIARLRSNPDELARDRGAAMEDTVEREQRLERQQRDLSSAGAVSQYWVLFSGFDARVGRQAYLDYQPAIPTGTAGIVAAVSGLVAGWILTHALAWPFRPRRRPEAPDRQRL